MSLIHNHEVTEAAYRSYNVPVKNKRKQEKPGADEFVESMQQMETFTFPIEGSNPEAPPKKMKVTVKKPRPGMDRWVGRVALVTGASSGIGHSVAKALVTLGMKVVGCARTVEPIQVLAREMQNQQGSLTAIRCDISKEAEVKNLFQTICKHKKLGTIHVIVNSAGLAHEAPLLSGDTSQWRSMLDVNILGTLTCTREAVNLMEEQGVDDGHIFLLNSMSGHRVLANKNIHFYGSTKYMITALTEGIRNELREKKTQTRVTAISPAVVETNFFGRMYNDTDRAQEFLSSAKFLEAKDVADAVIYALTAPPHVQVHDILMRATEQVS
ncbi:dehydrogenase/reductase SDR family member 11-like isoform X2 [Littorina saxatilis]